MANAVEAVEFLPLTIANNASFGLSDMVIGDNTIASAGIISDPGVAPQATVTVSPATANVGDVVIVALRNYSPGDTLAGGVFDLGLVNHIPELATTGPFDALGNHVTRFKKPPFGNGVLPVPNTWTGGVLDPQSIVATEAGVGLTDTVNIDITPKLTIWFPVPATGDNGQPIACDLSGFSAAGTVSFSVDAVGHMINLGTTVTTDLDGTTTSSSPVFFVLGDTDFNGVLDNYFESGDHTVSAKGTTVGEEASSIFTVVSPAAAIFDTQSQVFSYAPTATPYGGVVAQTINRGAPLYEVIPGGSVRLTTTNPGGQDFKASTPYLILFENRQDTLNLIKVGGFTSTADGRIPLAVTFGVPDNALPGTHNILIAEDADANGEYDVTDPIVVGPDVLTVTVYSNAVVNIYIRHVGDSVTVDLLGLNPENETDPNQATVYQILVDRQANGLDMGDPVFPAEGFTPDKDGKAEVTFTVPEILGGPTDLYIVEKDTLNRLEPMSFVNSVNVDGWGNEGDGRREDAEIFITPNLILDKYTGNPGDTVAVSGKAFVPGVQYTVSFGLINDRWINQRGQVVTSFIADADGKVPAGVTFTVPTANNPGYGVVIDPTPASNYVDVAIDTGTGLNSVLMAGDQPIYVVGGEAATLVGAEALDETHVLVTFSGTLQSATANNVANYVVEEEAGTPVSVTAAAYNGTDYTVTLTLGAALEDGKTYEVTVSNLRDSFNNTVSGTVDFVYGGGGGPIPLPTEQKVEACDAACQTTAPMTVAGGLMDANFNYTAEAEVIAGVMSEDFSTVWWLTDSCTLSTGFEQAATDSMLFSCTGVPMPAGSDHGWVFWLVAPSDTADMGNDEWWNTGVYELMWYKLP
jgi:hypothetical protein